LVVLPELHLSEASSEPLVLSISALLNPKSFFEEVCIVLGFPEIESNILSLTVEYFGPELFSHNLLDNISTCLLVEVDG